MQQRLFFNMELLTNCKLLTAPLQSFVFLCSCIVCVFLNAPELHDEDGQFVCGWCKLNNNSFTIDLSDNSKVSKRLRGI